MSFDFDAAVTAPFRMQPGLRRLAPGAAQLTPTQAGSAAMREKLAVLSAFPSEALVAVEGFDPAPSLAALAAHAAAEHPQHWQWDGRTARALGVQVRDGDVAQHESGVFGLGDEVLRCLRALPPVWRLPGLLALAFEEDLAVVDARDGRIPWLAVALPSHWAPTAKVGRHFAEVHAPVAEGAAVVRAADALVALVSGAQRWERFVWTVTDWPRLHAHPARVPVERWPGFDPRRAWWRTERQTFMPVPQAGTAIFTIHVQLTPLAEAVKPAGRAARLHAAIASMSPAVLAYRGLAPVREPLLNWLAEVAAPARRP